MPYMWRWVALGFDPLSATIDEFWRVWIGPDMRLKSLFPCSRITRLQHGDSLLNIKIGPVNSVSLWIVNIVILVWWDQVLNLACLTFDIKRFSFRSKNENPLPILWAYFDFIWKIVTLFITFFRLWPNWDCRCVADGNYGCTSSQSSLSPLTSEVLSDWVSKPQNFAQPLPPLIL